MKKIEVNNGRHIEIESTPYGISVSHFDGKGEYEEGERFSDGEIVMALNLLRYMRDQNSTCAYVMPWREEEGRRFFRNNIDHGDLVEFRIFQ